MIEQEDAFLLSQHDVHLLFVSLEIAENELRKVMSKLGAYLSNRIKEEVVIFDLGLVQPCHRRPDSHMHSLKKLATLLTF